MPTASEKLAEELRARIVREYWAPGSRLPTRTKLISELGSCADVMQDAVKQLEAEGFLEVGARKKGTRVAPNPPHLARYRVVFPFGPDDARLTLTVDGGRSDALFERILPVSFPPTGEGKLATVSLLWSLFANTTSLRLDYQLGKMFRKSEPAGDDRGRIFVEKVELIEVLPTAAPISGSGWRVREGPPPCRRIAMPHNPIKLRGQDPRPGGRVVDVARLQRPGVGVDRACAPEGFSLGCDVPRRWRGGTARIGSKECVVRNGVARANHGA